MKVISSYLIIAELMENGNMIILPNLMNLPKLISTIFRHVNISSITLNINDDI